MSNSHQNCITLASAADASLMKITILQELWHSSKRQFLAFFELIFKVNLPPEDDVKEE